MIEVNKTCAHWIVAAVAMLALSTLAFIYSAGLAGTPIRSDGVGYYLYLPAALLDRDITLETIAKDYFKGEIPAWTGVRRYPETNLYLDKYLCGEAIMLLPFFLIGHCIALIFHYDANGFSAPYQIMVALGGAWYMVLGLHLLRKMLARVYESSIVCLTILALTLGTNLFHYATYDNSFSHVYSFFLFALFLCCTARWYRTTNLASTLSAALVGGLITLVRPTNSLFLLYIIFYGVTNAAALVTRIRFLACNLKYVLTGIAVYLFVLLPQLIYWKSITNHWVVFSYQGERFNFLRPHIFGVLFSVEKGLFFWSPVLFLGIVGLFFIRRSQPELFLPTLLYMPLNIYLISSWEAWTYGATFGHRAFTESIPIFACGFAALLQTASASPVVKRALFALTLLLVAVSISLMIKYWEGILPGAGVTWQTFVSVLFRL